MEELAFAAWIREINPYMVNWSNVPDYLEKNAFIKFARTCSTEDTIHFVTFLNWVYYVSKIFCFFLSVHFIILSNLHVKTSNCLK